MKSKLAVKYYNKANDLESEAEEEAELDEEEASEGSEPSTPCLSYGAKETYTRDGALESLADTLLAAQEETGTGLFCSIIGLLCSIIGLFLGLSARFTGRHSPGSTRRDLERELLWSKRDLLLLKETYYCPC